MRRLKTILLSLFAIATFSLFMMLNVTTVDGEFDITICGEAVMAEDGECKEVDGSVTPRILNFNYANPDWDGNCTYAGNGCIPCTSTPIED
jgi:hypothetical protein